MIQVLIEFAADIFERAMKVESGEKLTLNDRAPYPPDQPLEILPPLDEKKAAQKRKAVDHEFWETM